ncbi:MAG: glycine oxidase ThiO [Armatimonadota bacterium]|nr:glycine oxidase ThiO [Armatimonadota bacterium]MDR7438542.1 glycine oxidase ThiO [Armatimonadota bacterium]MDR7562350.1 glycine oxidase ThiO [Armatimonadota bacterium]MDR7601914.1 glycine oxidase ThiO [Armatimonadota bacterium]
MPEEVAIVGGGICGLSIGWYLARAGRSVTILEKGQAGLGATAAAAGMLAPYAEAEPGEEWMLPLLRASRDRWVAFAQELEAASGLVVDYRDEGTLVVALDRDDVERLRFLYGFQKRHGLPTEWLSGEEARRMEPYLSHRVAAAIRSPLDHQVDNVKVARALAEAFRRAGGRLRENTEVTRIVVDQGRVLGVRLPHTFLEASWVVLAAGAWSATLPGLPDSVRPPVRPVKGQMLAVQMPRDAPLLRHVVWGPDAYLVPRRDGRLLVGATVEEKGFDGSLTAGGILQLLRGAWEILPGIEELPLVDTWVGFRPGSRDDAPILGPTEVEGLVLATGHYRNGILLAPITAEVISHYILHGELLEIARPFTLDRFRKSRTVARIQE